MQKLDMLFKVLILTITILLSGCNLHPRAFHPEAIIAGDPLCERICGPVDAGPFNHE
jgi:hypothetical protein